MDRVLRFRLRTAVGLCLLMWLSLWLAASSHAQSTAEECMSEYSHCAQQCPSDNLSTRIPCLSGCASASDSCERAVPKAATEEQSGDADRLEIPEDVRRAAESFSGDGCEDAMPKYEGIVIKRRQSKCTKKPAVADDAPVPSQEPPKAAENAKDSGVKQSTAKFCGAIVESLTGNSSDYDGVFFGIHETSMEDACHIASSSTLAATRLYLGNGNWKVDPRYERITPVQCEKGGWFALASTKRWSDDGRQRLPPAFSIACGAPTRESAHQAALESCTSKGKGQCSVTMSALNEGRHFCGQPVVWRADEDSTKKLYQYRYLGSQVQLWSTDPNFPPEVLSCND